jgi:hypothetical protein
MTSENKFTLEEYLRFNINPRLLENLSNNELLWFAKSIEKLKPSLCKVTDYFTEVEIKENKSYLKEKVNIKDLLILQNATKLSDNQYSATCSVKDSSCLLNNSCSTSCTDFCSATPKSLTVKVFSI